MSSNQKFKLFNGTAWGILAEALILPSGLITAGVLTRCLGPEGYGLFTLASVIIAWIEWTITSIFGRTAVKFVSDSDNWHPVGTTILRLYLGVSGVATIVLWFSANKISILLNEPTLTIYLQVFALDIPLFCLAQGHRQILIGLGDFRERAIATTSRWTIRLVLIVILVQAGFSVSGAIIGSIGASIAELLVNRWFIRPALFSRSTFPVHKLFGYALPLFLFAASLRLYDKLDLLMLKLSGATAEIAGIYGSAQNLAFVPSLFAMSFSPILLSTLNYNLRSGDMIKAKLLARNAMRISLALLPFAALTAGSSNEIIQLVYGETFLPAAPLLAVLIFGSTTLVMISISTAILTAAGKPSWTLLLTAPMIPLSIIGYQLFLPAFGSQGASWVVTSVAAVGAVACFIAVYLCWEILPEFTTLIRSIVTCLLVYEIAINWSCSGLMLLFKLFAILLLLPFIFLLLGEFSLNEIKYLRTLYIFRLN